MIGLGRGIARADVVEGCSYLGVSAHRFNGIFRFWRADDQVRIAELGHGDAATAGARILPFHDVFLLTTDETRLSALMGFEEWWGRHGQGLVDATIAAAHAQVRAGGR